VNYSDNYNISGANHQLLRGVEFEIISDNMLTVCWPYADLYADSLHTSRA
jgi:hypothetical protein